MKEWEKEGQPEFDFSDCYITNYPPLDLSVYEGDRNYHFYELQNDLLLTYNKTHKIDKNILWQMFETIESVVGSLAKKNICVGPYFRAKKLENVAYWKMKEVFLDGNLQLNERATDFDYVSNLEREEDIKEGGTEEND